jgi:hypothetical protein
MIDLSWMESITHSSFSACEAIDCADRRVVISMEIEDRRSVVVYFVGCVESLDENSNGLLLLASTVHFPRLRF